MSTALALENSAKEGKDYVLQIRIKNGPMLRAMRAAGFPTAAALSQACGVPQTTIGHYMNLRVAPMRKDGEWRLSVTKISKALKLPPEFWFPEQHLTKALKRSSGEVEISKEEIAQIMSPEVDGIDTGLQRAQLLEKLSALMSERLTPREAQVLQMKFGLDDQPPLTGKEIAEKWGVTRSRIQQIEDKAFRKLSPKAVKRQLRDCGGFDWLDAISIKSEPPFVSSEEVEEETI